MLCKPLGSCKSICPSGCVYNESVSIWRGRKLRDARKLRRIVFGCWKKDKGNYTVKPVDQLEVAGIQSFFTGTFQYSVIESGWP
jgi:hypothetical protein